MDGFFNLLNSHDQGHLGGSTQKIILSAFTLTGVLFLSAKLLSFIRLILSLFVLPGKPLSSFGPPKSWAVITGASDGIGKEFALQLARSQKYSLLLISRTPSKLDALAQQIRSLNPSTATKTVAIDFAHASPADYDRLASLTNPLDIAILINNVGASHAIPVPFAQTDPSEMDRIITINCLATLRITHLIVPGMIARKRGLILNMGSFAGLLPTPLLATYSGSKAFLQQWSTALGAELAPFHISVELVQAHLVTSAMSKIRRPSLLVPSARGFVKAVLSRLGRTGGAQGWAYTCTPYWSHAVWQWVLALLVGFTGEWVVGQNRIMHEDIRKRALRKREREAGKKSI